MDGQALPIDDGRILESIQASDMTFECPKDKATYDLREYRWGMGGLVKFVSDIALGQYRAAQAASRGSK
jgi:hypothetical protein